MNPPSVSVILPAYNEEKSIFGVIRTAVTHPLIKEVIVVADGCTDKTIEQSKSAGATCVIELPENMGKGAAMEAGVKAAACDTIAFLDGDTIGLTHELLTQLITPVLKGELDMTTLWRGHFALSYYTMPSIVDLSGERCLKKDVWNLVPHHYRDGFKIEVALNYIARERGLRTKSILAKGLTAYSKEYKRGLIRGMYEHGSELAECMGALGSLYWERMSATNRN